MWYRVHARRHFPTMTVPPGSASSVETAAAMKPPNQKTLRRRRKATQTRFASNSTMAEKAGTPSQRAKAAQHQMEHGVSSMPNFSAAVSAQRHESTNSLDDFPTPPWGGRAWVEYVLGPDQARGRSLWEPAANRGYLLRGLRSYFDTVEGSDIHDYGVGFGLHDFLGDPDALFGHRPPISGTPDWIVTNPPFNRLLDFTLQGLKFAKVGVAIFCRLQALEGVGRYRKIFAPMADRYCFSQFAERISLVRGKLDPKAGRPAAYGWLTIWKEPMPAQFLLDRRHIPPCRSSMEREGDYAP